MDLDILKRKPYKKYAKYLQDGFEAIDKGDESMPFKFYPDAMPHPSSSQDPWDRYENEKFNEEYPSCEAFWSRVLCLAKAVRKLEDTKKTNPDINENEFIGGECQFDETGYHKGDSVCSGGLGGLAQLVAYGAMDRYLCENRPITFYKVVYNRKTDGP
jgi:hypothetical protein